MAAKHFDFSSALPSHLQSKDGSVPTTDALQNKVFGLYFSAHWCPPCRGFTPKLAETYNTLKAAGKNFEIVFVSSDKSADQFDEYFKEQPWLAVPFADRETKNALSKTFKVSGIPSLVLIDGSTGTVVNSDGRSVVGADPAGTKFPWTPEPLSKLLEGEFLSKDGAKVPHTALAGKVLGIYFSAHWCPPCRGFTPRLVETYNTLKAAGKDFEVIFASSDRDADSFEEYFGEMPWLSIPYEDRDRKEALSSYFKVNGIPSLALVDNDEARTVINSNGRGAVAADSTGVDFPWRPKPYNDINAVQDGLNDETCLVLLTDGMEQPARDAAVAALAAVAEKARAGGSGADLCFFYASKEDGVAERVRELTEQEGSAPAVVMLDIPDNGGFYVAPSAEMTEAALTQFIETYKSTPRQQMS